MDISNKRVAIVLHYLVYGAPQALKDYLLEQFKFKELIFITHPLNKEVKSSSVEFYLSLDKQKKANEFPRQSFPLPLASLIDWLITLISLRYPVDIYIGVDPLNCLLGVLLKKIGLVKYLVFYTIDFVPKRFENNLLNQIYHDIDRFCVKNADEVWDLSSRIMEGRKIDYSSKRKIVPIGVWINNIKVVEWEKVKKHQLLFLGNLLQKQGVQEVVKAIPEVVKNIKDFHFLVIGGGEYLQSLQDLTKELSVEKYVTFTGWIKDRKKLDETMNDSGLAVALYNQDKTSFTYYADPTKLKDYLSFGIPIILTDLPHNAKEIQKVGCGLIIKPNGKDIAGAIIKVMKSPNTQKRYRENALKYIKRFDWNNIFEDNIYKNLK